MSHGVIPQYDYKMLKAAGVSIVYSALALIILSPMDLRPTLILPADHVHWE